MAAARDGTSSDSEGSEDFDESSRKQENKACSYYNRQGCWNSNCAYLHVCKNVLEGISCQPKCKLNHDIQGAIVAADTQEIAQGPTLTDGRRFQWQLKRGRSWENIDNDHVIEINYCLPHAKGITLYNTPYGEVSIDFSRMRVLKMDMRVRRLDDGRSKWIWYCMLRHVWKSYGHKDAKGNSTPQCAAIEEHFTRNPRSSFTFSIGSAKYKICFRGMKQVGPKKNRAVRRRPVYRPNQQGNVIKKHEIQTDFKIYPQTLRGGQLLMVSGGQSITTITLKRGQKKSGSIRATGVCADFDLLQLINTTSLYPLVPSHQTRICHIPLGQTEDMGWYFIDDDLWREYGCVMDGTFPSLVGSKAIELKFCLNPKGSIRFKVGSAVYTLDFTSV